jgi:hypothetical protein
MPVVDDLQEIARLIERDRDEAPVHGEFVNSRTNGAVRAVLCIHRLCSFRQWGTIGAFTT